MQLARPADTRRSASDVCRPCPRQTREPTAKKQRLNALVAPTTDTSARQAPYWTGKSGPISRAINAAIDNETIWSVMRMGARNAMIKTAEKAGIAWKETVADLEACSELEQLRQQLTNPDLAYPDYANLKFHAYDQGNLDWQAVHEVEPATAATAVRVFRHDKMSAAEAVTAMRQNFLNGVQAFCREHDVDVHKVLDAGAAGGESTRWLAKHFPAAHVTGVDISAHFLALAELRRRQADFSDPASSVEYIHAEAEAVPLENGSLDLFAASYLLHELPAVATHRVLSEAHRLLRPGGVIALIDGDPWSDVHQKMPLPLATLMKSTEPYLDEYFALDLEAALRSAGFTYIQYVPMNHRHRLLVAKAVV